MHTDVILTNKRCTQAQSNYTNTKLKAWFRCLLRHPARKQSKPILHPAGPHGGGAMERHLPYSIIQCYLSPDTGERAPP